MVMLINLRDGAWFHDPDLLIEGVIRSRTRDGKVNVRLHRYKAGPEPEKQTTSVNGGWQVEPGELPADIKQAALRARAERSRADREKLGLEALALRKQGIGYTAISNQLRVPEALVKAVTEEAARDQGMAVEALPPVATHPDMLKDHTPTTDAPTPSKPVQTRNRLTKKERDRRDRKALALRKDGMSYPQIAAKLGMRYPANARTAVQRGAKLIGEEMPA